MLKIKMATPVGVAQCFPVKGLRSRTGRKGAIVTIKELGAAPASIGGAQ